MAALRGIKRLAIVIPALAAVGVGALLVLPFLMPPEAVRDAVKAEIRAVTGLDPVLRGATSVSLFPTGTVTLIRVEGRFELLAGGRSSSRFHKNAAPKLVGLRLVPDEIVLAEDPGKRAVAASMGEVAAAEAIDDGPLRRDVAVLVLASVHPVRHASTAATCNGAGKRLQVIRERHAAWLGQPAVGVLAHALPVARECRRCGAVAGPAPTAGHVRAASIPAAAVRAVIAQNRRRESGRAMGRIILRTWVPAAPSRPARGAAG